MNQKSKIILGVALIFLLGMVSGSLLTVQVGRATLKSVPERSAEDLSRVLGKALDHKLKLTSEQEAVIDEILAEGANEIEPMRREVRGKLLVIFEKYQPRIHAELTPAQRKKMAPITETMREALHPEKE